MSAAIDRLVALAKGQGMTGTLVCWTKADVWTFEGDMPDDIMLAGSADPALDYFWQAANGPHRADKGFIDGAAKVAI
ncbi:hypothetical protein [Aurantiacibacter zhengii]|uniref:Uncharacterized protein n=1 Tax=Aurantiacibacter zhengii TaxID=2307003 RepID=A0A418NSP3_9SPHN|nr:hypothetical protein [Aurantiacibacter zhengii]RIV86512.1 hypothetical protein D2V07_07240 [Aurantiacibacter zhengii]